MTETAGEIANDILLEIVVLGAEASMSPSETASTLRYMNRYMTMIDASGISLGYTKVTSTSDPITIPDGAIIGMIKNVAKMLAPQYGAVVTIELMEAANEGLKAMRDLAIDLQPTVYPSTLPVGSGNEWQGNEWSHFYPGDDALEDIITEGTRNILLEEGTDGA
jgi:hypothetical protein